jgi:TRAP transporter TAXI family solute receptor
MQNRMRFIIVGIIWIATLSAILFWFLATRGTHLTLAAGPRGSESFQLATAIATVFNETVSNARIDVFETGGSGENARLLKSGQVDLATVQADARVDENVTAVASLYFDAYQLIVKQGSGIRQFKDLAGHRVAIAPVGSGQNAAFWFLAKHYGLKPEQLTALPIAEAAADFAMTMDQVDAVFRVRVPGNAAIRQLVSHHPMELVPIRQANALALQQPALQAGVIPVGAYSGAPPLPKTDLATAVLARVLVAGSNVAPDLVHTLTRTLFEQHSELVALTGLAGFIQPIDSDSQISIPLHPGAQRYYDREKPGFWQRNTRIMASLLYVVAILTSVIIALRSRLLRVRKVHVSDYNRQLMEIAEQARHTDSHEQLLTLKDSLVGMLQHIVKDLSKDQVTQEEFEHFSFTWQAVDTVVRDRLMLAKGEN